MSDNKDIPYGGRLQFIEAKEHLKRWANLQPEVFIPATTESVASARAYLDEHIGAAWRVTP